MAVPWDSRCLVRITWEGRVIVRRSRLFSGETAYKGVIPARALVRMLKIPVTRKLAEFVKSWADEFVSDDNSALSRYFGMDLAEHLGARTFDLVWD